MRKLILSVILFLFAVSPAYSLSNLDDFYGLDSNWTSWYRDKTISIYTPTSLEANIKITWNSKKGEYLFALSDEKGNSLATAQAFKNPEQNSIIFTIKDQEGKEIGKIINDQFEPYYWSASLHAILYSAEGAPQLEDYFSQYRGVLESFVHYHSMFNPGEDPDKKFATVSMIVGNALKSSWTIQAQLLNKPYIKDVNIDLRNYVLFLAIRSEIFNFESEIIPLLPTN